MAKDEQSVSVLRRQFCISAGTEILFLHLVSLWCLAASKIARMSENTFPVCPADAIVNFYRTEVLTGQEAKHFTKSDLTPTPKVTFASASVKCCSRLVTKNRALDPITIKYYVLMTSKE